MDPAVAEEALGGRLGPAWVGVAEGAAVVDVVVVVTPTTLGGAEGAPDGAAVEGSTLGAADGTSDGIALGASDGTALGRAEGAAVVAIVRS